MEIYGYVGVRRGIFPPNLEIELRNKTEYDMRTSSATESGIVKRNQHLSCQMPDCRWTYSRMNNVYRTKFVFLSLLCAFSFLVRFPRIRCFVRFRFYGAFMYEYGLLG
jgi:hypothetical protein